MTHNLKIFPRFYEAVKSGKKTFEIRKNDENFQVGDSLRLLEFVPVNKKFSGRQMRARVTYVLKNDAECSDGEQFGLKRGYAILGLGSLTNNDYDYEF